MANDDTATTKTGIPPDELARARLFTLTRAQRFSGREPILGVSAWGAALGESPFSDPVEVWAECSGLKKGTGGNTATELGEDLEDGVARNAARFLGVLGLDSPPTLRHPDEPHFVATPDRIVTAVGPNARPGVRVGDLMQVKTSYLTRPVRRRHVDAAWGKAGTSDVPSHVLIQCIGELYVARRWAELFPNVWGFPPPETNHVAAMIGGRGVQVFTVAWDPDLAALLLPRIRVFWAGVVDAEPPPIDESKAWGRELARQHPAGDSDVWRVSNAKTAEVIRAYVDAVAEEEAAAAAAAAAENLLKQEIGDAAGIKGPWGVVPWRNRVGRASFMKDLAVRRLLELARLFRDTRRAELAAIGEHLGRVAVAKDDDARSDAVHELEVFVSGCGELFDVPDDVDAVAAYFVSRGKPGRSFGPVEVAREVLDVAHPPEGGMAHDVAVDVLNETWRMAKEKGITVGEARERVVAALDVGDALTVADVLALPLAQPTPLVSPDVIDKLDRATEALAKAKREYGRPSAKKEKKPNPWSAPLPAGLGDPVPTMLARPSACRCSLRAVLGRAKDGTPECYSCGAVGDVPGPVIGDDADVVDPTVDDGADDLATLTREADAAALVGRVVVDVSISAPRFVPDGDPFVITRKNTRPTVQRVYLDGEGAWTPDLSRAERFSDELSAAKRKPRQTRVARVSELPALDEKKEEVPDADT